MISITLRLLERKNLWSPEMDQSQMRTVSGEVRKVQMDLNFLNNGLLKYLMLWKRPAIRGTIIGFPAKWRLTMLMMCHYPDLGGASDWLKIYFSQSEALPRSGLWRVISMEFLRSTSFLVETSGGVAICRLFSQAIGPL